MTPPNVTTTPSTGWQNMNDESQLTIAETGVAPNASLDLDLGSEQDVDTVRVVNWTTNLEESKRLNFVTLKVSDGKNNVVFFYTFEGIHEKSPVVFNFNMKGEIIASPLVRFLRLEQTVGRKDFVTVAQLEAHHGSQRLVAVEGKVEPLMMWNQNGTQVMHPASDWKLMNDGLTTTITTTDAAPNAYLELDFGEGGKEVDRIRVVHWLASAVYQPIVSKRLNGVALLVMDSDRNIIFQYTFNGMDEKSPITFDFNMKGDWLHG